MPFTNSTPWSDGREKSPTHGPTTCVKIWNLASSRLFYCHKAHRTYCRNPSYKAYGSSSGSNSFFALWKPMLCWDDNQSVQNFHPQNHFGFLCFGQQAFIAAEFFTIRSTTEVHHSGGATNKGAGYKNEICGTWVSCIIQEWWSDTWSCDDKSFSPFWQLGRSCCQTVILTELLWRPSDGLKY